MRDINNNNLKTHENNPASHDNLSPHEGRMFPVTHPCINITEMEKITGALSKSSSTVHKLNLLQK